MYRKLVTNQPFRNAGGRHKLKQTYGLVTFRAVEDQICPFTNLGSKWYYKQQQHLFCPLTVFFVLDDPPVVPYFTGSSRRVAIDNPFHLLYCIVTACVLHFSTFSRFSRIFFRHPRSRPPPFPIDRRMQCLAQ